MEFDNITTSNLEVIIGDSAKMDCTKAINYIESGKKEIEQAVEDGIGVLLSKCADRSLSNLTAAGEAKFVKPSALATVATTGSYNDLTNKPTIPAAQVNSDWDAVSGVAQILNKPTIPTVNDATLTIQKNGTDVQTFTANASSNVTANITVPTDTSDLTNNAGFITSSALSGYQTTANLVTSVSSASTDTQYPSAKLFYDTCGDIETLINAL